MATQIPTKRGYVVNGPHGPRIHGQPTVSPEHYGQQKSFVEAYPFSRVDPRLIYAIPPSAQRTPPSDSQDAKRRRFNGSGAYVPSGQPYPEPTYAYPHSPLNNPSTRGEAMQQVHASQIPVQRIHGMQPMKAAMISPPRGVYPHPPQLQPVRPPHPHQRTRSSVALPPIETVLAQAPLTASSISSQTSGVEAMIMSIPILNKIKVLSQISGPLPAPGLTSPKPHVRGAIIAIEGMDSISVKSITASLADQLGREGNFAVKIFDGPDPYSLIRQAKGGNHGCHGNITTETYLKMLSEWHRTNKEMVKYITARPTGQAGDEDIPIDMEAPESKAAITPIRGSYTDVPLSAISPKTIHKASELSIVTPPSTKGRSQSTPGGRFADDESSIVVDKDRNTIHPLPAPLMFPPPMNSSRIPPLPAPTAAPISESPLRDPSRDDTSQAISKPETSQENQISQTPASQQPTQNDGCPIIPIALVPHFQLTTVDASSISMPISDGFSPPAHWQWFATLWRGSVGPDVTIVIKSTDEDLPDGTSTLGSTMNTDGGVSGPAGSTDANNRATGPRTASTTASNVSTSSHSHSQGPTAARDRASGSTSGMSGSNAAPTSSSGVEIRLNDYRAVIVKTGIISSAMGSGASDAGVVDKQVSAKELEYWEKAKRRVGFEVAEFLRK